MGIVIEAIASADSEGTVDLRKRELDFPDEIQFGSLANNVPLKSGKTVHEMNVRHRTPEKCPCGASQPLPPGWTTREVDGATHYIDTKKRDTGPVHPAARIAVNDPAYPPSDEVYLYVCPESDTVYAEIKQNELFEVFKSGDDDRKFQDLSKRYEITVDLDREFW